VRFPNVKYVINTPRDAPAFNWIIYDAIEAIHGSLSTLIIQKKERSPFLD